MTITTSNKKLDIHRPFTIQFPNEDTKIGFADVCSKETLHKIYMDKKGKYINFQGVKKLVKNVRITDKYIFIDLE